MHTKLPKKLLQLSSVLWFFFYFLCFLRKPRVSILSLFCSFLSIIMSIKSEFLILPSPTYPINEKVCPLDGILRCQLEESGGRCDDIDSKVKTSMEDFRSLKSRENHLEIDTFPVREQWISKTFKFQRKIR